MFYSFAFAPFLTHRLVLRLKTSYNGSPVHFMKRSRTLTIKLDTSEISFGGTDLILGELSSVDTPIRDIGGHL